MLQICIDLNFILFLWVLRLVLCKLLPSLSLLHIYTELLCS